MTCKLEARGRECVNTSATAVVGNNFREMEKECEAGLLTRVEADELIHLMTGARNRYEKELSLSGSSVTPSAPDNKGLSSTSLNFVI